MVACPTCGGVIRPDEVNGGEKWPCLFCDAEICDWCYWRHAAEKHSGVEVHKKQKPRR